MAGQRSSERSRVVSRAALASFALAFGVSLALLFVPTVSTSCFSTATSSDGQVESHESCNGRVSHESLVANEGWRVAVLLAVPVVLSGGALALQATRFRRSAAIIAGGSFSASLSWVRSRSGFSTCQAPWRCSWQGNP